MSLQTNIIRANKVKDNINLQSAFIITLMKVGHLRKRQTLVISAWKLANGIFKLKKVQEKYKPHLTQSFLKYRLQKSQY